MTTTTTTRPTPVTRFAARVRGFVALVAGLAVIAGTPVLLHAVAPHPFPRHVDVSSVWRRVSTGYIDDHAVVNTASVAGWVLWALLTMSLITETIPVLRRWRPARLPFTGLSRVWVQTAALLFATAISTVTPALSALGHPRPAIAAAGPPPPPADTVSTIRRVVEPPVGERYHVVAGDTLRSLAASHYGDPERWRVIRDASVGIVQPDGTRLPASFTALTVGMALRIPASVHVVEPGDTLSEIVDTHYQPDTAIDRARLVRLVVDTNRDASDGNGHTFHDANLINPGMTLRLPPDDPPATTSIDTEAVESWIVQPGDTLSSIAQAVYGDETRWPDLADANPDIDDPNLIYPGQVLHLPDTTPDAGSSEPTAAATPDAPPEPVRDVDTTTVPPTTPTRNTDVAPPETRPGLTTSPSAPPVTAGTAIPPTATRVTETPAAARRQPTATPRLLGVAGGLIAAGVGADVIRRRRRAYQHRQPHQKPAATPADLAPVNTAVLVREVDDVAWLTAELAHLANAMPANMRDDTIIQLVHLDITGVLEVAVEHVADPPAGSGWVPAAGRVWQLPTAHDPDLLARYHDLTPLLPALVTLGDPDNGTGSLRLNLEAVTAINLTGDAAMIDAYLTSLVWELATGTHTEHPTIVLAGVAIPGTEQFADINRLDADDALDVAHRHGTSVDEQLRGRSLLTVRGGPHNTWPPLIVITNDKTNTDRWRALADLPTVTVITINSPLADALEIELRDSTITIPAWKLTCTAQLLTVAAATNLADLVTAADNPPEPDDLTIPTPPAPDQPDEPRLNGHHVDTTVLEPATTIANLSDDDVGHVDDRDDFDAACAVDSWEPPNPAVVVHVLGPISARRDDGTEITLPPQQLAALAFLALHRDVTVREFCEAIWGQDPETLGRRPRDLLYALRRTVGGTDIVPEIDGHHLHAGPGLGADTNLIEALLERARQHPTETLTRLRQALDVATGRPFLIPNRGRNSWRWVSERLLDNTWCGRLSTIAYELATHHLNTGNPQQALEVAEHALRLVPADEPCTEILLTATIILHGHTAAENLLARHEQTLFDIDDDSDHLHALLARAAARAAAYRPADGEHTEQLASIDGAAT